MWSRCAVLGSGHVPFEAPGSCGAPEMNPRPGKAAALGLTDPTWINRVGFATVEWFQEATSILQSVFAALSNTSVLSRSDEKPKSEAVSGR